MIFDELTFGGEVPLGTVARLYGFAVSEAEWQIDARRIRAHAPVLHADATRPYLEPREGCSAS